MTTLPAHRSVDNQLKMGVGALPQTQGHLAGLVFNDQLNNTVLNSTRVAASLAQLGQPAEPAIDTTRHSA